MEIKNNLRVRDISEIDLDKAKPTEQTIISGSDGAKVGYRRRESKNFKPNKKVGRLALYFSDRKYFYLIFSVIFLIGVITGLLIIKGANAGDAYSLREALDSRNMGLTSADMTSRILNTAAVNLIMQFIIYTAGFTVFSSFMSAAIFLYKGTSLGYISGIYLIGGMGDFHIAVCLLNLLLNVVCVIFFISAASESLSFSVFLLKSEDSYRKSLSFENISRYSSRHLLFIALISAASTALAVIPPLFYSAFF